MLSVKKMIFQREKDKCRYVCRMATDHVRCGM